MSTIKITVAGGKLSVVSPYNPSFPAKAKALGGKWASPAWVFDARDEVRVRALCLAVYGDDGNPIAAEDMLTIRVAFDDSGSLDGPAESEWIAGRKVASIRGRDSGAVLGDGVICIAGGFGSGGSMKHPRITRRDGTIVEIRDVPRVAAEKAHNTYHGVTLLDAAGNVVAEATQPEPEAPPAQVLPVEEAAAMAGIEIDRTAERDALATEIAAAEGRLAGLRFRAAEIAE